MYNNPYMTSYGPQVTRDRIDSQIAQLQQMKEQLSQNQTPAINQTFQLAPTQSGIRFVNSIEDVNKEIVYNDTPYFSHDLSVLWIKNNKGNVRVFELKEIVPKDEKDMVIESLQLQVNELKEMMNNAKSNSSNVNESNESEESSSISNSRTSKKK